MFVESGGEVEVGRLEDEGWKVRLFGLARVVLRGRLGIVGAEGGGGREKERSDVLGRREARQRKHSPVP